ncbi:MAG: M48 family metalloprotease [Thiobacillaceae bacterium]
MIPSSPKRTWWSLILSSLAYFGPDLCVPAVWAHTPTYIVLSNLYQGTLVVLGFWFGPAICRALMVHEIRMGPLYACTEREQAGLRAAGLAEPPIVLFDHAAPFVLTVGLVPKRCAVFISTGLVSRMTPLALKFLLARAAVHAALRHRLAALLPMLVFTVLLPDDLKSVSTWLVGGGFLILWLMMHWFFELDADRCAARAVGGDARAALREWLLATNPHPAWLTPHPPLKWRLRAVQARG